VNDAVGKLAHPGHGAPFLPRPWLQHRRYPILYEHSGLISSFRAAAS
jgi:hypothetical protein